MNYNTVGEIYESLEKTRKEIYEKVSGLTEEEQKFRLDENSWSVADVVEHLAKTEASIIPLFFKLLKKAEEENLVSDGNLNPPVTFSPYAPKVENVKLQAPEIIVPEGKSTMAELIGKLEKRERQFWICVRVLKPQITQKPIFRTEFWEI